MTKFVLLFRGINVGGRNLLPMKELVEVLEDAGFKNIKTYIQSGNVVLESDIKPSSEIADIIEKHFGFKPDVIVIDESQFLESVNDNPFSTGEGKQIHFYFCAEPPKLNAEKIDHLVGVTEQYKLLDNMFYLFAPDGIGRSKLVSNIESCLGVKATGRNLNTVNKLAQMLDS